MVRKMISVKSLIFFFLDSQASMSDVINGYRLWKLNAIDPMFCMRKTSLDLLDVINYVKKWRTGKDLRKPFPGFNPGVYKLQNKLPFSTDPTLHFVLKGRPNGLWVRDVVDEQKVLIDRSLRCAIHIHVYYEDVLMDLMLRIASNRCLPDIFLTLAPGVNRLKVESAVFSYEGKVEYIWLVENIGRDIGPFLMDLPKKFFEDYDVVGHVHTKKSVEFNNREFGSVWYSFMADNLIGSVLMWRNLDLVLAAFERDEKLGIVFPDDPHCLGWSDNYYAARWLFPDLDLPPGEALFDFPVGSFFFARPQAISMILNLKLGKNDMPLEPLPYDGTVIHAIERLFGLVPGISGFHCKSINVIGTTR
jgi:lipopolysaccharide biosynthesis protein